MARRDDIEYKIAVRDIAQYAYLSLGPFDRVKTAEWMRKLSNVKASNIESSRLRNEYAQLMRIMVKGGVLHHPFHELPPEGDLAPLAEAISACLVKKVRKLPKAGPIAPIISHHSEGGQIYLAAKQIPAGGVFCYLACSPNPLSDIL